MNDVSIAGVQSVGGGSIGHVSEKLYDGMNISTYTVPKSPLPVFAETDRLFRKTKSLVSELSKDNDAVLLPRDVLLAGVRPTSVDAVVCPIVHDLYHYSDERVDLFYSFALNRAARNIRQSSVILSISERTKAELVNRFGIPKSRIAVFTQGIDTGRMYRDTDNPTVDIPEKYLLYVGSLMRRKRPDILIKVLSELDNKELVICGNQYDSSHTNSLKYLANDYGVSDRLYILGQVSTENLRRIYSNATVLLHPAEYEGYGRTPVEAAACGTPTVLHESIPSVKDISSVAYTFSDYDPKAIARTVRSVPEESFEYDPVTWDESANQVYKILASFLN